MDSYYSLVPSDASFSECGLAIKFLGHFQAKSDAMSHAELEAIAVFQSYQIEMLAKNLKFMLAASECMYFAINSLGKISTVLKTGGGAIDSAIEAYSLSPSDAVYVASRKGIECFLMKFEAI